MTIYLESSSGRLVGWLLTKEQAFDGSQDIEDVGARSRELMTMPYDEYLQSPEWKVTRRQAVKAAGYRCQLCNTAERLEVHHRTYDRRGVELPGDVIALCRPCHEMFHQHSRLDEEAG